MYQTTVYSDEKSSVFESNMTFIEENNAQLYSYNNQNSFNQPRLDLDSHEPNVDIRFKTEELPSHIIEESKYYSSDPFIVDDDMNSQNNFIYRQANSNDDLNFLPHNNESRVIQKTNAFTNYHSSLDNNSSESTSPGLAINLFDQSNQRYINLRVYK